MSAKQSSKMSSTLSYIYFENIAFEILLWDKSPSLFLENVMNIPVILIIRFSCFEVFSP